MTPLTLKTLDACIARQLKARKLYNKEWDTIDEADTTYTTLLGLHNALQVATLASSNQTKDKCL